MKSSDLGNSVRVSERTCSEKRAGRPRRLGKEAVAELREMYLTYPYSVRELADIFDVSRMTVWRTVRGC